MVNKSIMEVVRDYYEISETKALNETKGNIEEWFVACQLERSNPHKQLLKLVEEFGELNAAIARNEKDKVYDAIGDMVVVYTGLLLQLKNTSLKKPDETTRLLMLILKRLYCITEAIMLLQPYGNIATEISHLEMLLSEFATKQGTTLTSCVNDVYDIIKHRTGKTVNGIFIKDEDV